MLERRGGAGAPRVPRAPWDNLPRHRPRVRVGGLEVTGGRRGGGRGWNPPPGHLPVGAGSAKGEGRSGATRQCGIMLLKCGVRKPSPRGSTSTHVDARSSS